jgi:putative transposase
LAISRQNKRSTSRRSAGAPGDFIGDLPVNAFIHPAGRPIDTSRLEVLRRPVESAQYTSIHFGQTLFLEGLTPSIGSVGDALDNALAETTIGLYKTECVRDDSPFRRGLLATLPDLEEVTSAWVHWYNTHRLMHRLGRIPPAEAQALYYATIETATPAAHKN